MAEEMGQAGPNGRMLLPGETPDGDLEFPFKFPLRKPVKAFDEELSALTLQEPTADHGLKYSLFTQGLTDETAINLLCDLSGVPVASLKKMSLKDMTRIVTILSRFLVQGAR